MACPFCVGTEGANSYYIGLMRDCLGLSCRTPIRHPSTRDVVFVSVSVEQDREICSTTDPKGQIGVAILDTRDLVDSDPHRDMISTHNFVLGKPDYVRYATDSFIFGDAKHIGQDKVVLMMEGLISRSRNLILVSHNMAVDRAVLRRLGFDLETSFVAILDTNRLAKAMSHSTRGYSLARLLRALEIPFRNLQSAGNFAHFILRCFLFLSVIIYRNDGALAGLYADSQTEERARHLVRIARKPIPGDLDDIPGPLSRDAFRLLRSQRARPRDRDKSVQSGIRAHRVARHARKMYVRRQEDTTAEEKTAEEACSEEETAEQMSDEETAAEEETSPEEKATEEMAAEDEPIQQGGITRFIRGFLETLYRSCISDNPPFLFVIFSF